MTLPAYEVLARAFVAEGVEMMFALMGDANMHFVYALSRHNNVRIIHTRHEHCACAAAMSYSLATGQLGVASVTCGPGFTQTMTALTTAVQARVPLLIFAGEAPIGARFHNQRIDQPPFAAAAGARYIQAHSAARMFDQVREAFHDARTKRMPVVLGIPTDLQRQAIAKHSEYVPSTSLPSPLSRLTPEPETVQEIVRLIRAAERPIVIAGRGAVEADAQPDIEHLAARCGALLATTMPAKGLFDGNEFSLGIAGGFASDLAFELFANCDLVIAIGASMSSHTSHGGKLYPQARVVLIDREPSVFRHGLRIADIALRCDARDGVRAILRALGPQESTRAGYRSATLVSRIATESEDRRTFLVEPSSFDPRQVIASLDNVIPKDWDVVSGSGHSAYFTTLMRGRSPRRFHVLREFGAIGNGLSYAMGVAASRSEGKVLLLEGDGGLMMHIQELETIKRHGLRLVIGAMNDGGFGAELHKFRSEGLDPSIHIFGRPDLASIAKGFGLRGSSITSLNQFGTLLHEYEAADRAEVWDIPISDQVTSLYQRRQSGH
jgi:thiamine pyrophosphate-dependent acetolactate synthase large subunit-like protein